MNRRSFLAKMGQGTLAVSAADALIANSSSSLAAEKAPVKNWMWTGGDERSSADDQKRRFEKIRAAGIHAVLFSGFNPSVLALAKAAGLETHAWTWTLCRGDKELLEKHPDWYVVNRLGDSASNKPPYVGYYHFLCPSHVEVQEHLAKMFAKLSETENLDGVHLDYIRYPDVILPVALWKQYNLVQNEELAPFDFCYCPTCRQAFKKDTGEDPLRLSDPAASAAWRQYRYYTVTRLVNQLVEVAHEKRKQITAAVFPTPSLAKQLVRQDWVRWKLDAVLPMVYHSFYLEKTDWIEGAVREGVTGLPSHRPLYAGLYLPDLKTDDEVDEAVRRAMAGGAKGVALFGGLKKLKNT